MFNRVHIFQFDASLFYESTWSFAVFHSNKMVTFYTILSRAAFKVASFIISSFELRFNVFDAIFLKYRRYIERELFLPGVSNHAIITAELGERLIKVTSIEYG